MKILITGLGNSGKSTLREKLAEHCLKNHSLHQVFDCDRDHLRMPTEDDFEDDTLYFVEDVHGLTSEAFYPIKFYDEIYYVLPSWLTHLRLWFFRMWIWFKRGKFGFDPDTKISDGWRGSGIPYDTTNIRPILKELKRAFKWRNNWIVYDDTSLKQSKKPITFVTPKIKKRKIIFYINNKNTQWPDIL